MQLPRNAEATDRSGLEAAGGAFFPVEFLLIAAFAIILRLPYLSLSVFGDPDEESYILAAREVLLGHLPYTTYWDHKPLGSTILMAAFMGTLGQSVQAVRLLGMISVIATASLLHLLTRQIFPEHRIPLVAALLYLAFTVALPGTSTMTEILLAPFTATGVLLLAQVPRRSKEFGMTLTFGASGLAFGIAAWIKYVPAIPAATTACVALLAVSGRLGFGPARALGMGALFFTGFLAPTIASIAFYAWRTTLHVFFDANFGFVSRYTGELHDHPYGPIFSAISNTSKVVQDAWPLLMAAMAAFLPLARKHLFAPRHSYLSALVVSWLIGEMLSVIVQTKFYFYQYLLILPPLCILSAAAIGVYSNSLARPSKAAVVTMVAAVFLILGPAVTHLRAVAANLSRPDVPREVAKVIVSDSKPGDSVFIVNYEPIIYLLAKTPLPTPYAYPAALLGSHEALVPVSPHDEVRRILGMEPKFVVLNQSWRDTTVYWDPEIMTFVEATLSRNYVRRKSWTLPENNGTVALFVRSDRPTR